LSRWCRTDRVGVGRLNEPGRLVGDGDVAEREVRSLKSIAWPLLAPVPVDLIVPALSIVNVPVAVG